MDMQHIYLISKGTRTATLGGTLLSICGNLHLDDLVRTAILAGVGAMVSFIVSVTLNFLLKRLKKTLPDTEPHPQGSREGT